jgi:hypothetical protein
MLLTVGLLQAVEPDPQPAQAGDLVAWRPPTGDWTAAQDVALKPSEPSRFTITPGEGILFNGAEGRTVDLLTQGEFGDVQIHVEFCISRHSNSGIYLMGRYEVQIYDSHGVAKDQYPGIECGGIYPRWTEARGEFEGHSPQVNASKPAGTQDRVGPVRQSGSQRTTRTRECRRSRPHARRSLGNRNCPGPLADPGGPRPRRHQERDPALSNVEVIVQTHARTQGVRP